MQVDVRRLKTFRTFRDDGISITGAGTPQEKENVVHRTVVEFIIQLEEPITNTDEELDPTQAAGLLLVRCPVCHDAACCAMLCYTNKLSKTLAKMD